MANLILPTCANETKICKILLTFQTVYFEFQIQRNGWKQKMFGFYFIFHNFILHIFYMAQLKNPWVDICMFVMWKLWGQRNTIYINYVCFNCNCKPEPQLCLLTLLCSGAKDHPKMSLLTEQCFPKLEMFN